ncbi:trehalose-phosphatase [Aeromicrobium sp. UC242_57]|uniref:trehalose-phosphatase n=1 Tax=Aeromicrobium sp. UC242_57 TaxID=3374624 RepID=UPI0037A9A793
MARSRTSSTTPTSAFAHPRAVAALGRLGAVLGQVAIVTGRPVDQAVALGGFEGRPGLERLVIYGQYGAESWHADGSGGARPERPDGIARLAELLPGWLADRGLGDLRIEDKGLAVAIHTRESGPEALDALREPIYRLAEELGLSVEPGRQVVELRAPGSNKGEAVRRLAHDLGARQIIFAGDDLGDLPAFDAVDALRADGVAGLLICSASPEQDALVSRADLVLAGPDAVAEWLEALADEF